MKKIIALLCLIPLTFNTIAQETVKGLQFSACVNKNISPTFYKGKFLVLDFWATWCGPCIGSFSRMKMLETKYRSDSRIVFATITGEQKGKIDTFYSRNKERMPDAYHLVDKKGATFSYYHVEAIPIVLVFNTAGKLVYRGNVNDLQKDMDELLAGKTMISATTKHSPEPDAWEQYKKRASFIALTCPADTASNIDGTYSQNGNTVTFSLRKESIADVLGDVGHISDARMKIKDFTKAGQLIDIYYKQAKNSFPEFDSGIFQQQYQNHILRLLESSYDFHCTWITEKCVAYKIMVQDSSVLNKNISISTYGSAMSTVDREKKIRLLTNNKLPAIAKCAENSLGVIIIAGDENSRGYDVTLEFSSMDAFRKSLQGYGLALQLVPEYETKKLLVTFD